MKTMTRGVFLDSDVIIDFLSGRMPFANDSKRVIALSLKRKVELVTSAVVICNVYYILSKLSDKKVAAKAINGLLPYIGILPIHKTTVEKAFQSRSPDLEDAIQFYAVKENPQIVTICTRNIKDFPKSGLSVVTPKELLARLEV